MSATLRYDCGRAIYALINSEDDTLTPPFGFRPVSRWAGIQRAQQGQRNECYTFAIKLPEQVAPAWRLLRATLRLSVLRPMTQPRSQPGMWSEVLTGPAIRGCGILAAKLIASLGLPHRIDVVMEGDEVAFLKAINSNPGELTIWHGYADWLRECDSDKHAPQAANRGDVIFGWLNPKKAMKVKYGVPEVTGNTYKHVGVCVRQGQDLLKAIVGDAYEGAPS